jgi:hypothetical protein
MVTQDSQPRPRGFAARFRDPYSGQQRLSDAERQVVTDRLSQHFADGRLDHAEFDERVGRAMTAKTRADLSGLFADLPDTAAPAVPGRPRPRTRPRPRYRHPVLLIALIVILAMAAGHAVLWLAFAAVAVVFATRALLHPRSGHGR